MHHNLSAQQENGVGETYDGIDLPVTLGVVLFDMLKLGRLLERRYVPVKFSQPLMQCRITRPDIADVTLEMLHIDRVEANDGSVEANVRFGYVGTKVVGSGVFSKVSFGAVERGEKGFDGFLIGFLCSDDCELTAEAPTTMLREGATGDRTYEAKPDL